MSVVAEKIDRADWISWRKGGVGSSDAPAIAGVSPWADRLDVYAEKIGASPGKTETLDMRLGKLLEPTIALLASRRLGPLIDAQLCVTNESLPFVRATLDGRTVDGEPVELKLVGPHAAQQWGFADDEIPDAYAVQVQHQLLASGADCGHVAALFYTTDLLKRLLLDGLEPEGLADELDDDAFRLYAAPRHEPMVARLIELEEEFWGHVERREPPPPGERTDPRIYACLYPEAHGEVALGDAGRIQWLNYESLGPEIKRLTEARERAKCELLAAIGPNEYGILPTGDRIRRCVIDVAERMQPIKAHKQTRLYFKGAKSNG